MCLSVASSSGAGTKHQLQRPTERCRRCWWKWDAVHKLYSCSRLPARDVIYETICNVLATYVRNSCCEIVSLLTSWLSTIARQRSTSLRISNNSTRSPSAFLKYCAGHNAPRLIYTGHTALVCTHILNTALKHPCTAALAVETSSGFRALKTW